MFAMMDPLAQIKLVLTVLIALALVAGTAYVTHRWDNARYLALELEYSQASAKAAEAARQEQVRLDGLSHDADSREIARQSAISRRLEHELATVHQHVVVHGCISFGLVRVLDAAVLGLDTARLNLPAGKSDAACTNITADALARSIIANYGTAEKNAEQLNALIALIKEATRR